VGTVHAPRAVSSVGERPPHTREVSGSKPLPPTIIPGNRLLPLAAALLGLLIAGCGLELEPPEAADPARWQTAVPDDVPSPPPPEPPATALPDGIDELLRGVSAAFLDGDPEALRPWLADPEDPFGQRWLERAANLADVPLEAYELEIDPTTPDLATAAARARHGDGSLVIHVRERHAISGFDADGGPVEDMFLTLVPAEEGAEQDEVDAWRVAGDRDAESLGLSSTRHLWDVAPVTATRSGPFVALHHPQTPADIGTLLSEARAAMEDVRARWPVGWSEAVPLIVPRDEEELGTVLNVTFELSQFIAFATGSSVEELDDHHVSGGRVVLNPSRFLERGAETRRSILAHELAHVATRPVTGPMVPNWLEEGVAQRLGEDRSTTGTSLIDAALASRSIDRLPLDAEFTAPEQRTVFTAYQLSWSFVSHLVDRYGAEAVGRFYVEVGRGSVGHPGRRPYHLDRAARAVFEAGFEELWREWAGTPAST
jgi:hypothetical protein